MPAKIHVFGIRHHGPGSARSLKDALADLKPDCILVEGPPEGEAVLPLIADAEMQPPVALLIYAPDSPRKAVYYPFAAFSPEWQALTFAVSRSIPVRFIDLPQTHWLAMDSRYGGANGEDHPGEGERKDSERKRTTGSNPEKLRRDGPGSGNEDSGESGRGETSEDGINLANKDTERTDSDEPGSEPVNDINDSESDPESSVRHDPLSWLAKAAGYSDGERFWEHMVEQRRDSQELFAAILEAMSALRREMPGREEKMEPYREAHMRHAIRTAEKEGHANIAVICGAWHAPVLAEMPPAKADAALLKGLPKVKVEATWIPWTYGRLSYSSGYGAGVTSPGWYHHLWTCTESVIERWMTRVARLLRGEDLDASSAHVIEAVRLATSLAALRGRPLPGLVEVTESTQAVLCFGNDVPMRLIHNRLIVGEVLGSVPQATPSTPLEKDLQREQKRLRMPAEAAEKIYDLDLRKENDLDRSRLLHRLNLLAVPWGRQQTVSGKSGTFHEVWALRWMPEYSLALIEAGKWGRTIIEAASACARDAADKAGELPALTELLDRVLLADLPETAGYVMLRVQNLAALAGDIKHLMQAIPPLVRVARYGNVRQTDARAVEHVLNGLIARVCVGLPGACSALGDEAAQPMFQQLTQVHSAVMLLNDDEQSKPWQEMLFKLIDGYSVHGLVAGRACRLLLETGAVEEKEAARLFGLALSIAQGPTEAANWAEGFLKGSGLLLVHNDSLWNVIDDWVSSLSGDAFIQIVPLLRRTFSTFQPAERRQMGERVVRGGASKTAKLVSGPLDLKRADAVLPVVALLLGLDEAVGD